MKYLTILFFLLTSTDSFADVTKIRKKECVNADLSSIQKLFTNYNNYKYLPGSKFKYDIIGNEIILLEMVESKEEKLPSSSNVLIRLKPINVKKSDLFPEFTLNCEVTRTDINLIQKCDMMDNRFHFGIKNIKIRMLATLKSEMGKTPYIAPLFDEEKFFEDYFSNLYTEWFKTL